MKHVERKVWLTDDLQGAGHAETVRFSLEGREFQIDLNKRNRETFVRRFKPYMDAGREVVKPIPSDSRLGTSNATAVREWAWSQGLRVASHGRIPADVLGKYEEAHWPAEEAVND